jgi:hypothetical protein
MIFPWASCCIRWRCFERQEPSADAQGVHRAAVHTSQHPRGADQPCGEGHPAAAAAGGSSVAGVFSDDGHGEPLDGGPPDTHQDAAAARIPGHAPTPNALAAVVAARTCQGAAVALVEGHGRAHLDTLHQQASTSVGRSKLGLSLVAAVFRTVFQACV